MPVFTGSKIKIGRWYLQYCWQNIWVWFALFGFVKEIFHAFCTVGWRIFALLSSSNNMGIIYTMCCVKCLVYWMLRYINRNIAPKKLKDWNASFTGSFSSLHVLFRVRSKSLKWSYYHLNVFRFWLECNFCSLWCLCKNQTNENYTSWI